MGPSLSPSSTGAYEHQYPSSPDDEEFDHFDFEFRPLLPRRPRGSRARTGRPRTARRVTDHACTVTQPPSQLARRVSKVAAAAKAEPAPAPARKVRWHHMAFGTVRVPSAMDMGEIRRRLKARQELAGGGTNEPSAAGWAPWRLIRSLSCKGVEAAAVATAAAPLRLA